MPLEMDGVTLVVMAVDNCNLNCRYCSTTNDSYAEVSLEAVDTTIAGLKSHFGEVTVGLSGGEPTMHSQFSDLIETIAKHDANFYVVTNGYGFDEVLPILRNHRNCLSHVMFSLESANPEHNDHIRGKGAFETVLQAIDQCHQNGVPMSIGCALNRNNIGQIDGLLRLAEENMVVDGVFCWPAFPTKTLVEDGLVLTEADRAYLVKKSQQMANENQVIFGDLFRFDTFYQECAPLRYRQFTLHANNQFSFCCNLAIYRQPQNNSDDLGNVLKTDISELLNRHIDHAKEYQKFLISDTCQNTPDGLRAYPCFHCQSYHGKLDWLPESIEKRQESGTQTAADHELIQIKI